MAFLSGIIQYRGKLGQTIGRKNGNTSVQSAVTRTQNVVGVAPESVNNPRTVQQAAQRLKMRPAANFYRDMGYILNHSWQGTQYRARSRNRFMQQALRSSTNVIPFLKKGDTRFVPGSYPLSEGALVGAEVTAVSAGLAVSSIIIESQYTTVGELSQAIYNSNPGFLYGDKLTFVLVYMKGTSYDDYQFTPVSLQLVLDNSDTTTIADFVASSQLFTSVADERLQFSVAGEAYRDYTLCAAAVIQSRVPSTSDGEWQRSNAKLFLTDAVLNAFMTAGAYNEALASYQNNAAAVNSEWYLNYGTYATRGVSGGSTVSGSLFNIAQITLPEYSGRDAVTLTNVAAISSGNVVEVIVSDTGGNDASRNVYTSVGNNNVTASTIVPALLARLLSSGYGTILFSTAQSQFGLTIQTSTGNNGGEEAGEDRP